MSKQPMPDRLDGAQLAARIERRWAILAVGLMIVLVATMVYTGLHWAMMPPSRVETIDPTTLHVSGEFVESNLGTAREPDGSVTVRVIGQQYSFTPQCILVPANTPVTFRATSADVVHGFLITDTNINSMLEPGYVATFRTTFDKPRDHLMPCHEYCGTGHEGMWAHVKVIDRAEFDKLASSARRLSCVKE
ncbi:cytochrome c oxidase subunit II [Burkholderia pseudomallei]|uniref:Cytochrome C oxidase subunit II n=2 Tax=Burkholderia pseudomallei TaxID=28450 RepID=A0AAX0UCQ0_BURPE|nr:cytochrome C oxidase subunit II, periplasmic domain protein [Burkholderia pseudomallei MSHR5858]AJX81961.1 cytochrome C oxidase subunit II, periplasmic domain protein [Burkholderia pseudomallei 7894]AJX94547.1 cytochrome C oxidase subunit II, periplasmic domain protein [Burkholderia pseudomallei PB08298010]AYX35921.1 cytochrome C oxidase subunit II [Burkholderia pseudomallei]EIF76310.1 cytochrome c oxidase, subunit II [Burkholderia pseudomallei 354e]EIF80664.1 cytochrome c oxidase, subunit 